MPQCEIPFEELKPSLQAHRKKYGITEGCTSRAYGVLNGRQLCYGHYQRELKKETTNDTE